MHRARARRGTTSRPPRPPGGEPPAATSSDLQTRRDRLPLAWRPDTSLSYRGPVLRALPDLAQLPAREALAPARPPVIRNAFVGRDAALREVVRRLSLPDGRLVTITGR